MGYPVHEEFGLQGIDQRLQANSTGAHPLHQCRSRNGQARSLEDGFLSIQVKMVGVLATST